MVELVAGEDFSYALAPGEQVTIELPGVGFVYAPVKEGDTAGFAHVLVNGSPAGAVEVLYGQTVDAVPSSKKSFKQKLLDFFGIDP